VSGADVIKGEEAAARDNGLPRDAPQLAAAVPRAGWQQHHGRLQVACAQRRTGLRAHGCSALLPSFASKADAIHWLMPSRYVPG